MMIHKQTPKERSLRDLLKIFLSTGMTIVVLCFLGSVVESGFVLVPPIIQQIYTDNIITGKNPDWFWPTILVYALFIVLVIVTQIFVIYKARINRAKYHAEINAAYIWHAMRMPIGEILKYTPGDLISRASRSDSGLAKIMQSVLPIICKTIVIFVSFAVMYAFCWQLATMVLVLDIVSVVAMTISTKTTKKMSKDVETKQRELQGRTMSILKSIETVKSLGAEYSVYNTWHNAYVSALNSRVEMNRSIIRKTFIPLSCNVLGGALILIMGCKYILDGIITPGVLLAFQSFAVISYSPIMKIMDVLQVLFKASASLDAYQDVMETECALPENLTENIPENYGHPKLSGDIELRNVTFGYNHESGALLHNFSMKVKPGESVAFVGLSGCGKSTVAKLISGLYEPWEGDVLFDGKPYKEIPRIIFTNSVSVINQDIVLFEGSVADNIKMWDDTIEDYSMIYSSYQAQIHDIIAERKGAYNSEVIDNGKNFSGGQRQRLEIAAAIAKDPTILIMDEATAALDNETERKVMECVRAMGITLIIIAHRLSTIRDCNQIFVMEYGHVLQHGKHDELMQDKNGLYYKLNS